jgi:hypothetical protein
VKQKTVISLVFLLLGLIGAGAGIYLMVTPAIPEEYAAKTQAVIVEITSRRDDDDDIVNDVTVRYEVDGKTYEARLNYYTMGMTEGGRVEIDYDTRNPEIISSPGDRLTGGIIALVFGVLFFFFGVWFLKSPIRTDEGSVARKGGDDPWNA